MESKNNGEKRLFNIMPKNYLFTIISLLASIVTYGNDYAVLASGSSLQPADSKDINVEVKEEILTIRLTDETEACVRNGYTSYHTKAYVDVDYTFYNHGEATDMLVAFVAYFPYNIPYPLEYDIFAGNPYIHDFKAEVNGQSQPVSISVPGMPKNYKQELLEDQSGPVIYDGKVLENCLYTFPAKFVKGENKVHHTYSYDLCSSVFACWNLEYALSPASHWKGGKIGKFTLRVECPNTAKHFYVDCEDLQKVSPIFTKGVGKYRKVSPNEFLSIWEISMRDAVAQWTMYEYSPKSRLDIYSGITAEYDSSLLPYGFSYDRSLVFEPRYANLSGQPRILRNMPYAHRGYVFKTKEMKKIFEKLWWYIPDSTYVPDMSDFTERELEFINGTYKEKKEE